MPKPVAMDRSFGVSCGGRPARRSGLELRRAASRGACLHQRPAADRIVLGEALVGRQQAQREAGHHADAQQQLVVGAVHVGPGRGRGPEVRGQGHDARLHPRQLRGITPLGGIPQVVDAARRQRRVGRQQRRGPVEGGGREQVHVEVVGELGRQRAARRGRGPGSRSPAWSRPGWASGPRVGRSRRRSASGRCGPGCSAGTRLSGKAPQTSSKKRSTSVSARRPQAGSEIWNARAPRSYAMRSRSTMAGVDSPMTPTITSAPAAAASSRNAAVTAREARAYPPRAPPPRCRTRTAAGTRPRRARAPAPGTAAPGSGRRHPRGRRRRRGCRGGGGRWGRSRRGLQVGRGDGHGFTRSRAR